MKPTDRYFNPANLRTRITFQQPTVSTDAGGAQSPAWTDVESHPTVWAHWVNAHGQENVQNAVKSVRRATVTIRHRDDVRTTWAVVRGTERWDIISIDAVQDQRRWIELVVERAEGSV